MDARQIGDGGGREFERVAEALRTRMVDGTYPLKSRLPAQRDLAEEFAVSRDTVQRALRELAEEGWIESRQGSGSLVIKTSPTQSSTPKVTRSRHGVALGSIISEAFEQPEVRLDIFTLTSESLDAHIRFQAERIRVGEVAPQSIAVRLLLPDENLSLPYPRFMGDPADPRPQERLHSITLRHTNSMRATLKYLEDEGLVPSVDVQVQRVPLVPAFKLYLLNGTEALLGMYEVLERQIELDSGEEVAALDVLGLGATLTRHTKDENDPYSPGSVFVESMYAWFESVSTHLAR